MKKTEFAIVHDGSDRQLSIDAGKHDEYELPEFSREVPTSSRKRESNGSVIQEYDWKDSKAELVRVRKIEFRRGESLEGLYRVAARDGADSITFRHENTTYILRRTVREIAQAIYNAYGKIKGALENVVGYLRTVLGNDYVISKVEKESWAFDRRIAKGDVHYVDVDSLDRKGKSRLCELITERIADLHTSNLIIGRFTLNNILLDSKDMTFTDLRKLRVSRRRSFVIDEFKSIMQYLFAVGVASREDVYASIAYYTSQNDGGCREWYSEKTGKKAADQMDIAGKIEEEIYG